MNEQRHTAKYYLAHIAASEVWVILGALLMIFWAAPHFYGTPTILAFLANPHLCPVILMGVGVWFFGMMGQGLLLRSNQGKPGERSSHLWVPIKAGLLVALLMPIPGLNGSLSTHFLAKWVQLIA